ncbi:hypothetical protein [Rhodoferax sp. GW822-FHT02A01]|uniref:hypothetical protein n=1 Tax=Rhodoferax sp. GW822-FHT02A01 TaxID=3141537 RepID=UPI00315DC6BC
MNKHIILQMKNPIQIKIVLLSLTICFGVSAIAEETTAPAVESPPSKVVKVKKAIKHGATAAVHGVERGAHAVANGVERGAAATDRALKKVVRKVKGTNSPAPSETDSK